MSDPRLDLRRRLLASFDPLARRAYDWVVTLELDDAAKADHIAALEARVTELTSAARELLEATDTLAIAAARHHLRRTLAAEKGDEA